MFRLQDLAKTDIEDILAEVVRPSPPVATAALPGRMHKIVTSMQNLQELKV
jgi:hypothetical protein